MIARGITEGQYLLAAGGADESRIVFRKSLGFHFTSLSNAEAREDVVNDRLGDGSAVYS